MKSKIFILLLLFSSCLLAEEWHVKKSKSNLVKFTSSTPLLDFDGTTDQIDGYIYWEGQQLFGGKNEIYFEVDLNSIETGIGKRDRDMREDVLETHKWPKTSFRGKILSSTLIDSTKNIYKVVSKGIIFIHGKEKEIDVAAEIIVSENLLNVKSSFSVFLNDYDIEAPSLLAFVKVAEEIKLTLDFELEKYSGN